MTTITDTLILNSKHRTSGTPNFYTYRLSQPIKKIKYLSVESVLMTHAEYTINSYNYRFSFKDNAGTDQYIDMTQGFYTTTELVSHMNDLITASGFTGTYTITYNDITSLITIESATGTIQLTDNSYNVLYSLGFRQNSYSAASSHTAENLPQFSTSYYNIVSNGFISNKSLANNSANSTIARNSIAIVEQYASNGSVVLKHPQIIHKLLVDTVSEISQFEIAVYNSDETLADLKSDWTMILKVVREL